MLGGEVGRSADIYQNSGLSRYDIIEHDLNRLCSGCLWFATSHGPPDYFFFIHAVCTIVILEHVYVQQKGSQPRARLLLEPRLIGAAAAERFTRA